MDHPVLVIFMRFLHIVCAILAVGGLAFVGLCLRPILNKIEDESFREDFRAKVKKRFAIVQWSAFGGLLVSGAYNWMLSMPAYKAAGPAANAMIGVKFLLALAVFAVAWAFGAKLIKSEKAASMINIHLAAIIILLAAVLRWYRLTHGA